MILQSMQIVAKQTADGIQTLLRNACVRSRAPAISNRQAPTEGLDADSLRIHVHASLKHMKCRQRG